MINEENMDGNGGGSGDGEADDGNAVTESDVQRGVQNESGVQN